MSFSKSDLEELGCEPMEDSEQEDSGPTPRDDGPVEDTSDTDSDKTGDAITLTPGGVHYECTVCKIKLSRKWALKRHQMTHDRTKMLSCSCCTRRFHDAFDLKQHNDAEHAGKRHKCDEPDCSKEYKTKAGLRKHINEHSGTFKFKCDVCSKGFNYVHKFSDHVNAHKGVRPHKCKCGSTFASESNFAFHKTTCGKLPDVSCDICGKLFKSQKYMKEHRHVHTSPRKYVCDRCGKSYSHRGGLKTHETRKHKL